MKRFLSVLLITACTQPVVVSPTGAPVRSLPFAVSNTDSSQLIQAAVAGHVDIYPDAIVVALVADSILSVAGMVDSTAGQAEIQLGLASGNRRGAWRIDLTSAALPLASRQTGRIAAGRDTLRFLIRGARERELSSRWLVIRLSSEFRDPRTQRRVAASNYLDVPVVLSDR